MLLIEIILKIIWVLIFSTLITGGILFFVAMRRLRKSIMKMMEDHIKWLNSIEDRL